jgi:hypothetical protein
VIAAVDPVVRLARHRFEAALDVMAGSIVPDGLDELERATWHGVRARIVEVAEEMVAAWAVRLGADRAKADEMLPVRTPFPGRPRVR